MERSHRIFPLLAAVRSSVPWGRCSGLFIHGGHVGRGQYACGRMRAGFPEGPGRSP